MGPVTTVLTIPLAGPIGALCWIARQIAEAVEQQMLDPTRIEKALRQLEKRLDAGEIGGAAFEAEEEALLGELAEIMAIRNGLAEQEGVS